MSRSILAFARSVLDAFATRPWVAVSAIVICSTELLGAQSVRAQLPDLSGNETVETAEDDLQCDRAATVQESRPESEKTPSDREQCDRVATVQESLRQSEAFSSVAGIPPPMFDYGAGDAVVAPEVRPSLPRTTPPTASIDRRVDRHSRSTNSLQESTPLESAPLPIFVPSNSMVQGGTPSSQAPVQLLSAKTASPRLPLPVPTPPQNSVMGNLAGVLAPPSSLPSRVPPSASFTSTVPDSPSNAMGCGLGDACAIPHPDESVLSTDELVAALPTRFSFEENSGTVAASPTLSQVSQVAHAADASSLGREALTPPRYQFQGVYLYQGDDASARARISGFYPLAPTVALGGSFDVTDGTAFADSQTQGASINELYLVASIPDLPNLRFSVGQLDLTSYFDRNSFAKDGATHFFNSVFQTNPALSRTGIGSRTGLLVNWSVTDNVEAKVAGFSSARRIEEFRVDGLAAELGVRQGNFIVRGTFATARDAGVDDGFREIFPLDRSNGGTGLLSDDREQAYGINAEVFVPEIGLGLFGRYGRYENIDAELGADTYSVGMNVLDLFLPRDRFGIAYGQDLSNNSLRRDNGDDLPDVLEAFYDFALLPSLRVGFSFQSLDEFSESILGIRVKTEFDMTPLQR
ncbi:MAG: hypothetical protein WBB29_22620 [Geitlerinemataceae cyanobacterium]